MTFAQNVEIKRYLRNLEESVAFLKQSDAGDWLPGKMKAKPQTLLELVQLLNDKNVRFAPSSVGCEAAYTTMHRALAALYAQASPAQVGVNR